MKRNNDNDSTPNNHDQITEKVNGTFENINQDVKRDVHEDNQFSSDNHQNIMNAIDEVVDVFNNNNPWRD